MVGARDFHLLLRDNINGFGRPHVIADLKALNLIAVAFSETFNHLIGNVVLITVGVSTVHILGHDVQLNVAPTHVGERLVQGIGHGITKRGDGNDRGDPDNDAQHGQQRPHLVGAQPFQGQFNILKQVHGVAPISPLCPPGCRQYCRHSG